MKAVTQTQIKAGQFRQVALILENQEDIERIHAIFLKGRVMDDLELRKHAPPSTFSGGKLRPYLLLDSYTHKDGIGISKFSYGRNFSSILSNPFIV